MATHKLFAYGTLLNPGTFARMTPNLEELISIEPAYIEGKMYTNGVSSSFPFVIKPKINQEPNHLGLYMEVLSHLRS